MSPPPSARPLAAKPAPPLAKLATPAAGQPGEPAADRFAWMLPVLLAVSFACMLVLPMASGWVLRTADAKAATASSTAAPTTFTLTAGPPISPPDVLTLRTCAFFLATFGAWGMILFIWGCCVYSITKGRSWALGLCGLPAASSFVVIVFTGSPLWGLLAFLGLAGFLLPYLLPVDRVMLGISRSVSTTALMSRLASESIWPWAFGLFLGASVAYGNSFHGGMTLDNKYIIEEYFHTIPHILPKVDLYSWTTMLPLFFQNDYWWPKGISGLYRPVAVLSYWLNYWANHAVGNQPLDPFQYHVVNFCLHWFTACLAFILVRQLTGRPAIAFFASLLFVTHPIATESVSNIIGRSDILAAIAVFACMSLYIRSTKEQAWRLAPWLAMVITIQVLIILFIIGASQFSPPPLLEFGSIFAAIFVPVVGGLAVWGSFKHKWTAAPWLVAMMGVLAVGLFAKESAIAVAGAIVAYDLIYRWTLEDLRRAVPSLLGFSILSAVTASVGLWIGQFGALGLSEGLKPVLVLLLVGSLLTAGGLVLAWVFWVLNKPLPMEQLIAPWKKFFLAYFLFIPPIVTWLLARSWVFANASPPETPFLDNPIRGLGFFAARMTASDVFLRLLGLIAWPLHLSCDYSFNQIPLFNGHVGSSETWIAVLGLLLLIAMIVLLGTSFKRHKLICFLIVFYLIAYLPTSNFLIVIGSIMAERFMYLPLIAFCVCVVLAAEALGRRWIDKWADQSGSNDRSFLRSTIVYGLLGALALTYGVRARFRNDDWFSDITLWTSAAENSPVSFRSYQSKAFALYELYVARGSAGVYNNDQALRDQDIDNCYNTAALAYPIVKPLPPEQNSSRLYLHLGMYALAKGQADGHFQPNGAIDPGDKAGEWFRTAEKVLQEGVVIDRTFDGVNRRKELARKIHPESEIADVGLPPIYSSLASAYARLGEWPKSIQAFKYMRHLDPVDPDAYLGIATGYSNQGRYEDESVAILQAIILDGKRTELWQALANALAQINHSGVPALTTQNGRIQLHVEIPEVKSVLCSAYQGMVRNCLLAKRQAMADQFRSAAIHDWQFPSSLFDDLVSDPDAEAPVPPLPD